MDGFAKDWQIGMQLAEWSGIGRLARNWQIGLKLADCPEIGILGRDWPGTDV